jgi:hypothetical protein
MSIGNALVTERRWTRNAQAKPETAGRITLPVIASLQFRSGGSENPGRCTVNALGLPDRIERRRILTLQKQFWASALNLASRSATRETWRSSHDHQPGRCGKFSIHIANGCQSQPYGRVVV